MEHEFLRCVYNENIYNIQDKFTRLFIKQGTMGGGTTQYGICIDENIEGQYCRPWEYWYRKPNCAISVEEDCSEALLEWIFGTFNVKNENEAYDTASLQGEFEHWGENIYPVAVMDDFLRNVYEIYKNLMCHPEKYVRRYYSEPMRIIELYDISDNRSILFDKLYKSSYDIQCEFLIQHIGIITDFYLAFYKALTAVRNTEPQAVKFVISGP